MYKKWGVQYGKYASYIVNTQKNVNYFSHRSLT